MSIVYREKKDFISDHDVLLVDLDSGEKLHFQGLPSNLEVAPTTEWATIKPFGRNNPHYHFTGSEDSLSFEVSWYATTEEHDDVIEKCKWIESGLKADGYMGRPHYFSLIWGEMFRKQRFIIYETSYSLTNFNGEKGYKPIYATQSLTLKRVTDHNLSLKEVLDWR